MTLPILAKKVKKLASFQLFNLKLLLNGESSRGFSKFKKNYKLKGELGRGGFGIVYRAIRIADELPVAVKFVDRRTVREWGKLNDEQVPMEICMLAKCGKVKGVVKLLDWYSIPEGYLIVMERPFPSIDMFDFIKGEQKLDEEMARFLFRQIVQTVHDCAQRRVLHRDLKDENVVIDLVSGEIRLIDFGAATILKKTPYTDFQGTRLYCPPCWFLHSLYLGKEAAVWSLGVLLYNALNGRLPFRNEKDICTAHLLGPLPFYAPVSTEAKDLIQRCLTFDPFSRCTIEQILAHPWLKKPSPDWLVLSAATGSSRHEQNKENDNEDNDESEELEEIAEESEKDRKEMELEGQHSSEGESGVGSSASSIATKHSPVEQNPEPNPRFSKTSLLVPPSSSELKAVVQSGKTKSVSQCPAPSTLRPRRMRSKILRAQNQSRPAAHRSTVLTALRRAMSRERHKHHAVEATPRA